MESTWKIWSDGDSSKITYIWYLTLVDKARKVVRSMRSVIQQLLSVTQEHVAQYILI